MSDEEKPKLEEPVKDCIWCKKMPQHPDWGRFCCECCKDSLEERMMDFEDMRADYNRSKGRD